MMLVIKSTCIAKTNVTDLACYVFIISIVCIYLVKHRRVYYEKLMLKDDMILKSIVAVMFNQENTNITLANINNCPDINNKAEYFL